MRSILAAFVRWRRQFIPEPEDDVPQGTVLYFDTNALRSLRFDKEMTPLLGACKNGALCIAVSEWAISEYARHQFQGDVKPIISPHDHARVLSGKAPDEILKIFIVYIKHVFTKNGAYIIEHSEELMNLAGDLIAEADSYFSATDLNDHRDALILASGLSSLDPKSTIVISHDNDLREEFKRRGFKVRTGAREFVTGLKLKRGSQKLPTVLEMLQDGQKIELADIFHSALRKLDPAYAALASPPSTADVRNALRAVDDMGQGDKEIRLRILSFIEWFAPITKEDLNRALHERQIPQDVIKSNLDRLVAAEMIRDTGNHYLPGDDGVCAAIGRDRISELADMLRGS